MMQELGPHPEGFEWPEQVANAVAGCECRSAQPAHQIIPERDRVGNSNAGADSK
jgi:hypothetical protein